jgi:hypothetical protein
MPDRKRSPPATRRGALELLARSRDGVPEALMLAHGFSIDMMGRASQRRARERDDRAHGPGLARIEVSRVCNKLRA